VNEYYTNYDNRSADFCVSILIPLPSVYFVENWFPRYYTVLNVSRIRCKVRAASTRVSAMPGRARLLGVDASSWGWENSLSYFSARSKSRLVYRVCCEHVVPRREWEKERKRKKDRQTERERERKRERETELWIQTRHVRSRRRLISPDDVRRQRSHFTR